VGACCVDDGSCQQVSEFACISQGGIYHGDGLACGAVPGGCIQPGACCLPTGLCEILSSAQCSVASGTYSGHGSTCAASPCAAGACCFSSGGCMVLVPSRCTSLAGTYQGDSSTCAASCAPMPPTMLLPPNAVNAGGSWRFTPDYRQILSGAGANAVRIVASAAPTAGSGYYQSDAQVRIIAPNGNTLLVGQESPISWTHADYFLGGTPPATSSNAQQVDATYAFDFGPMSGAWTFNIRGSQAIVSGAVNWNNIQIIPMALPGGSCCLPSSDCVGSNILDCTNAGGIFQEGVFCGMTTCPRFLPTVAPTSQLTGDNAGIFFDLTAASDLVITGFEHRPTVAAGTPIAVEVYTMPGSYVGHDTNPFIWTLHGVVQSISAGANVPLQLYMNDPIVMTPGQTVGVYLVAASGGLRFWHDPSRLTFSDDHLTLHGEHARTLPWAGTLSWPRVYAGKVFYSTGDEICYANCDNSTTDPVLNVEDFICFISEFSAGLTLPPAQQIEHYANCDRSTAVPVLNVEDFICFINSFSIGCP
jgi:hypothetical protein